MCKVCNTLTDQPGTACLVCGKTTALPHVVTLKRVWAFWIAGLAAYVPGNLLPIMFTHTNRILWLDDYWWCGYAIPSRQLRDCRRDFHR